MKSTDLIRGALEMGERAMMMLLDDLRSAPMTAPTPRGGNHPTWVVGHIAYTEGNVPHVLFGEPNPLAHWAHLFAPGSEPSPDPKTYPPLEELLRAYRDLRARNLATLEKLGEEGLARPTKSPPRGMEQTLGTAGQLLLVIAMHQMNHRGQLADARRALGRPPVFTPQF